MWFIVVCTLTDNEYVSLVVSQTFFLYLFRCAKDQNANYEGRIVFIQQFNSILKIKIKKSRWHTASYVS